MHWITVLGSRAKASERLAAALEQMQSLSGLAALVPTARDLRDPALDPVVLRRARELLESATAPRDRIEALHAIFSAGVPRVPRLALFPDLLLLFDAWLDGAEAFSATLNKRPSGFGLVKLRSDFRRIGSTRWIDRHRVAELYWLYVKARQANAASLLLEHYRDRASRAGSSSRGRDFVAAAAILWWERGPLAAAAWLERLIGKPDTPSGVLPLAARAWIEGRDFRRALAIASRREGWTRADMPALAAVM